MQEVPSRDPQEVTDDEAAGDEREDEQCTAKPIEADFGGLAGAPEPAPDRACGHPAVPTDDAEVQRAGRHADALVA